MRFSEPFNELAAALAKAQGDFGPLVKGRENPHFKSRYADLAAVLDVIRAPLAEHALCYVQGEVLDDTGRPVRLVTRLMHSSGQWVETDYPISVTDSRGGSAAQAVGSALTYARRYSLQALFGLAAEDDDGEAAQGRARDNRRDDSGPPRQHQEEPAPLVARANKLAATLPGGWAALDFYAAAKVGKAFGPFMAGLPGETEQAGVLLALEERAQTAGGSWPAAFKAAVGTAHVRAARSALVRMDFDDASKVDDLPAPALVGLTLYVMGLAKGEG